MTQRQTDRQTERKRVKESTSLEESHVVDMTNEIEDLKKKVAGKLRTISMTRRFEIVKLVRTGENPSCKEVNSKSALCHNVSYPMLLLLRKFLLSQAVQHFRLHGHVHDIAAWDMASELMVWSWHKPNPSLELFRAMRSCLSFRSGSIPDQSAARLWGGTCSACGQSQNGGAVSSAAS